MSKTPAVMVKFDEARDQSARTSEIKELVGNELVESRPLFPDSEDVELSTLFEIVLKANCQADLVLEKLRAQDDVEYAHFPADRQTK